jgi:hypothetical protein
MSSICVVNHDHVPATGETVGDANDRASRRKWRPYLEEVSSVRKTLDSRYDDLKTGRVKPINGEEAFKKLREKSERRRSDG